MKQPRRIVIPRSLLVAVALGAPAAGCGPSGAQDAAVVDVVPSEACAVELCAQGPLAICAPDEAGVLACTSGECVAVFDLDGGPLGTQCYRGDCVVSTLADGATATGFC